jgi:hypothetical protein
MLARVAADASCINPRRQLRLWRPRGWKEAIGAIRTSRQLQRMALTERPKRHRGNTPRLILADTVERTSSARRTSSVLNWPTTVYLPVVGFLCDRVGSRPEGRIGTRRELSIVWQYDQAPAFRHE